MPETIVIKQGLDINLLGEAEKKISELEAGCFALKPTDFFGVFPKLLVSEGDRVKAGTPIFFDKYREKIRFSSPVSGTVREIRRGAKRVVLEIKITADSENTFEDFGKADPASLSRDKIIEKLLQSGIWPMIRQRPYSIIADPADQPKAIFISGFDSSPLAPDYNFMVQNYGLEFQTGINALAKLTNGKVHLNIRAGDGNSRVFTEAANVQINYFKGPHPTGNVGVQINKIDPINKGEVVWFLRPQEVLTIGRLFLEGRYDSERVIAFTGSEVLKPRYFKTKVGSCLHKLVEGNIASGKPRIISGNVLTGTKIDKDGYIGFYDSQVTVIPEGDHFEFLGWAMPRLQKFSFSKTFFSWLTPKRKYRLDTNLNGGHRAFVLTGEYEKVFPMNILPMQLLKAILIKDIDLMENLGIYEVDEEDFALCEFIDASKTEMQAIVREGLDYIRKEMN